ncbi:hypothetical protein SUGI_1034820 [Cryptomeria japonica]|nr:hypothetical protein SUGI_1034820 [Cryptomeria japonica]
MEGNMCIQTVCASRLRRENVKWQRPNKDWVKLNFDGASKGNPGRAGGGGVFRDDKGNIMAVYAEAYGWESAYYAEARALFRGIQIAAEQGWTRLEIEGDCMIIVNALNNEGYGHWNNDVLIQNARLLCTTFQEWKCMHVYREGNRLADVMANCGVYLGCSESIVMTKDWPQVMSDLAKDEVAHLLCR